MGTLWLARSAADQLAEEGADKSPNETGGILLGYWGIPKKEAVVVRAVGPGPDATHGPYSFTPDGEYHWKEIEAEYMATGGQHTYLGDWHTHPDARAYLSPRDRKTLKKIALCPESQAPQPIMVVLSGMDCWAASAWTWTLRRWKGLPLGWRAKAMEVRLFE